MLLWAPPGGRADELAEVVGARRHSLTALYGPRYFAPFRYAVLFFRTLVLLIRERPDVVYAQNPPVFCPLTSLLYCRVARKRLVIDHHCVWRIKTISGAMGRPIGFFEEFADRAAYANTTPHSVWAAHLRAMGARRVLVVHDYVAGSGYKRDENVRRKYVKGGFLAIASHGGHPLERIESEMQAAGAVEGLTLVVTGPEAKLGSRLSRFPSIPNVRYLGMLPMREYLALEASCDFALNITDEPYTLSHAIFEYVANSLPVISSRQEVVEEVFGDSVLYVDDSSPNAVASKIIELLNSPSLLEALRVKLSAKQVQLEAERHEEISRLMSLMS